MDWINIVLESELNWIDVNVYGTELKKNIFKR